MAHLTNVLRQLRRTKLVAKVSKCTFCREEVQYLGQIFGGGRVRPDPAKVLAVQAWQPPRNVHDVRAFLGFAGQLRKHIRGYAKVVAPISDQLRGKKKIKTIVWDQRCQQAFDEIKRRVCDAPILQLYDPTKEVLLQTDASDTATGAVLLQRSQDEDWLPVAYESRRLAQSEQHYSVYEKELLAVLQALRAFDTYLVGRTFLIQTDHRTLERLQGQKVTRDRVARWVEQMQRYDFKIAYQKGKLNVLADALSRLWAREPTTEDLLDHTLEDAPSSTHLGRPIPVQEAEAEVCMISLQDIWMGHDDPKWGSHEVMEATHDKLVMFCGLTCATVLSTQMIKRLKEATSVTAVSSVSTLH